jgi:hypothetical protein
MKKVLVFATIIVASVFFCSIDSLLDSKLVQWEGVILVVLVCADLVFVSGEDLNQIIGEDNIDKNIK